MVSDIGHSEAQKALARIRGDFGCFSGQHARGQKRNTAPSPSGCQTAGGGGAPRTEPLPSWIITRLYKGPLEHAAKKGGKRSFPITAGNAPPPVGGWQETLHYENDTAAGTSAPGTGAAPGPVGALALPGPGSAAPGAPPPRSPPPLQLPAPWPPPGSSRSSPWSHTKPGAPPARPAAPASASAPPSLRPPPSLSSPAPQTPAGAMAAALTVRLKLSARPRPRLSLGRSPFEIRTPPPNGHAGLPAAPASVHRLGAYTAKTPRAARRRSRWMPKGRRGGAVGAPSSLRPLRGFLPPSPRLLHPVRVLAPCPHKLGGAELGDGSVGWSLGDKCLSPKIGFKTSCPLQFGG